MLSVSRASGVGDLEGRSTRMGYSGVESSGEPCECWVMSRRVGISTSDLVGVLGLERRRRSGDGDGEREGPREDALVNRLPVARGWVQLTGWMNNSIAPCGLSARNELAEVRGLSERSRVPECPGEPSGDGA